jgi:hypothetical protein
MNINGHRILKTTAAVVSISALGALGSGTAFAAIPTGTTTDGASTSHAASEMNLPSPASSKGDDLHSFAMPKAVSHTAEPTTGYDNNDNNDNFGYRGSNYDSSNSYDSRYSDNYNNAYPNNYHNGYSDNYNNGYYNNGYRHDDNGLLGGGLLGGNN